MYTLFDNIWPNSQETEAMQVDTTGHEIKKVEFSGQFQSLESRPIQIDASC